MKFQVENGAADKVVRIIIILGPLINALYNWYKSRKGKKPTTPSTPTS